MIILASASPRRKDLLKKIVNEFTVLSSNISEDIPSNITAMDAAEYLAVQKAMDVYNKNPNDLIIGADTTIVFNDKIYGKPKDKEDAKKMLTKFSGNTHYVITGICIICKDKKISFSSINRVQFYPLKEAEIQNYLMDDEYIDKAGAYAIQGKGSLFVKEIMGDYNSIVGLPISQLKRVLETFFNI